MGESCSGTMQLSSEGIVQYKAHVRRQLSLTTLLIVRHNLARPETME